MTNQLSETALLLHASAIERDTLEDPDRGQVWLETQLGGAVKASSATVGWDLNEVTDAELGAEIWRRLRSIKKQTLSVDLLSDSILSAILEGYASNSVDEAALAMLCGIGVDKELAVFIAALTLREETATRSSQTSGLEK